MITIAFLFHPWYPLTITCKIYVKHVKGIYARIDVWRERKGREG